MRKPTIYEVLRDKLGREPTHAELVADVKRILEESLVERAGRGQLPHQRRHARTVP
jgi:hypothetical protein